MLFASDIDGKSAGDSREPAKEGAALFSERSEAVGSAGRTAIHTSEG